MELQEHYERVRALACRMECKRDRLAVLAIGYTANKDTGITSGYTLTALQTLSRRRKDQGISRANLKRAMVDLQKANVLKVTRHVNRTSGKRECNSYKLNFDWPETLKDITEI